MFGVPLVLNIKLIVPLVVTPLVVSIIAIIATYTGLVPPLRGIGAPLGTPIFVNGFLEGGFRVALLQAVLLVVSFVMYYPFFKSLDKEAVKTEEAAEQAELEKKAVSQ